MLPIKPCTIVMRGNKDITYLSSSSVKMTRITDGEGTATVCGSENVLSIRGREIEDTV